MNVLVAEKSIFEEKKRKNFHSILLKAIQWNMSQKGILNAGTPGNTIPRIK
jgi:hypothetical protein